MFIVSTHFCNNFFQILISVNDKSVYFQIASLHTTYSLSPNKLCTAKKKSSRNCTVFNKLCTNIHGAYQNDEVSVSQCATARTIHKIDQITSDYYSCYQPLAALAATAFRLCVSRSASRLRNGHCVLAGPAKTTVFGTVLLLLSSQHRTHYRSGDVVEGFVHLYNTQNSTACE